MEISNSSIEAFARKGEKNILKNMFREENDSSDDSMSDSEDEQYGTTSGVPTAGNEMIENIHISSNCTDISENRKNIKVASGDTMVNVEDAVSVSIEVYHSSTKAFQISLHQEKIKGIAHQLWPAATHLSKYLETNLDTLLPSNSVECINVLELGAGIGLCGLVCSKLNFKKVIVTDLPVAIDILNSNIALNNTVTSTNGGRRIIVIEKGDIENKSIPLDIADHVVDCGTMERESSSHCTIEARVLSWGNHDELASVMEHFDRSFPVLVIAADCVYWESLFKPLYDTITKLVSQYNCEIIISHVRRWKKDEKFFKMCRKTMIVELLEEIREYVPAEHTGVLTREIKRIYRIRSK
jgi:predicted nicotinamide N-methyase